MPASHTMIPIKRNNVIDDIFYKQNEAKLGDTGQDMIKYNNNIYVSMYGSKYVCKLNEACVEQARYSFLQTSKDSLAIWLLKTENFTLL